MKESRDARAKQCVLSAYTCMRVQPDMSSNMTRTRRNAWTSTGCIYMHMNACGCSIESMLHIVAGRHEVTLAV